MKYTIEIELPDNDTVRQTIKTDEFEWFWHGYHGRAKAKENRWIPCSERLPKENGEYLVTIEMLDGTFEIDIDKFMINKWNYYEMETVTAWMPLLEPYRGDNDV